MALSGLGAGSDGLLGLAISGRTAQDLATAWWLYNVDGLAGRAMTRNHTPHARPFTPMRSHFLSLPPPSLVPPPAAV